MISEERIQELESYFWDESNDEETQIWRDSLTSEEKTLISKWDEMYRKGFHTLCEQILKLTKNNDNK